MMLLTGPGLNDGISAWESWRTQLHHMDQSDETIEFAIKRAEAVLRRLSGNHPNVDIANDSGLTETG